MKQAAFLVVLAVASSAFADAGITIDLGALGAKRPHAAAASTQIAPRAPRMPAVLAHKMGHAENAQMYTQLLAGFEQVVDKAKLAKNDIAVAAAIYIAGSYAAYHGSEVSDAGFAAMVPQLRDVLAATPAFASASMDRKQDMYETFAIVGTLMWSTARQKRGDQAVRAMGKSYLDAFFRGNVDTLRITDGGMLVDGAQPTVAPDLTPPSNAPKVAHLFWRSEAHYEAFPANSMVMREIKYVAFADGTIHDGGVSNLVAFDAAADRAAHPKAWGKWRKTGSGFEANWGNKWESIGNMTELHGGKRGERLTGSWQRKQTRSIGTASTYRGTALVLGADGRFDSTVSTHFSSNTNVNRPDGEVVVSGAGGTHGGTWNAGNASGGVSGRTAGTSDHSGTYLVDGFVLELHYDGGNVERHSFAIAAGGSWVELDGTMMWSTDNKK